MSLKKLLLLFVFSSLVFTLTVWIGDKSQNRTLSSTENSINTVQKIEKPQQNYFEISIQNLSGDLPNDEVKEVRLVGIIKANQIPNGSVNYKWILPEGINLVSGIKEDNLENFKAGQTAQVEISIDGMSKNSDPSAIVLHVDTVVNGTRFGKTAVFTNTSTSSNEEVQSKIFKSNSNKEKSEILKRRQGIQY